MDRVSDSQLQVSENSNKSTWRLKGSTNMSNFHLFEVVDRGSETHVQRGGIFWKILSEVNENVAISS